MATMRVNQYSGVATFVISRKDGHELSLASDNSLVHWHAASIVQDFGESYSVEEFLRIASEFIAGE